MAEPLDVDARLAEGRPAVGNVGDYVWACHLLGYQNPDLTLHAAQVRDWYGSEDGLDLRALDADRAALEAVATAADGARQLQERQIDALADAWQGRGGDASREFLLRHGQASAAAASAVRNAVDALAALREDLWHAVDDKVANAVAIEDRRQSERAQWQAAAQTVTTGAGDRAVASEMVDQQVKPFVDNDIRTDWLTAMQKAMAAVTAAFDAATGALTGESPADFEVPGDLGPSAVPSWSGGTASAGPAGTAPAGWPSQASPAAPHCRPDGGATGIRRRAGTASRSVDAGSADRRAARDSAHVRDAVHALDAVARRTGWGPARRRGRTRRSRFSVRRRHRWSAESP